MEEIAIAYLAGGVSSRFGFKPKLLAVVSDDGETLIEKSLSQSLKAGFNKIFFIVNDQTEILFRAKFGDSYKGVPVFYSIQKYDPKKRDRPWGTLDALCTLKGKINCSFVVCNGDDLYGEETFKILHHHLSSSLASKKFEAATAWYKLEEVVPEEGSVNRGIFGEEEGYVKTIKETLSIEKKNILERGLSPEDKCSMNIFALHPKNLEDLNKFLLDFKEENRGDREKECFVGSGITDSIKKGRLKMKLYPTNAKWIGVTNPEDVSLVKEYFKEN